MLTNNEMAILTIYEQVLCFKWAKFWHDQKVFPLIHYIYIFKKLTQGCFSFNPVVFRKHNILFFFFVFRFSFKNSYSFKYRWYNQKLKLANGKMGSVFMIRFCGRRKANDWVGELTSTILCFNDGTRKAHWITEARSPKTLRNRN